MLARRWMNKRNRKGTIHGCYLPGQSVLAGSTNAERWLTRNQLAYVDYNPVSPYRPGSNCLLDVSWRSFYPETGLHVSCPISCTTPSGSRRIECASKQRKLHVLHLPGAKFLLEVECMNVHRQDGLHVGLPTLLHNACWGFLKVFLQSTQLSPEVKRTALDYKGKTHVVYPHTDEVLAGITIAESRLYYQ